MTTQQVREPSGLSIRVKMRALFACFVLVTMGMGAVGAWPLWRVTETTKEIADRWLPSTETLAEMELVLAGERVALYRHLTGTVARDMTAAERDLAAAASTMKELQERYQPLIISTDAKAIYDRIKLRLAEYRGQAEEILALSRAKANDEAMALMGESITVFDGLISELRRAITLNHKGSHDAREDAVQEEEWGFALLGATALLMTLLSIAAAIYFDRAVVRGIGRMTGAVKALAAGAWDTPVPDLERGDELGEVARAVGVFKEVGMRTNRRAVTVDQLIRQFESLSAQVIETVASAATELQASAEGLAKTSGLTARQAGAVANATDQASSNVQLVASATTELAASISEINQQISGASRISTRAVEIVQGTDTKVRKLSEAAGTISSVVALIEGIAEQTNLLALNATIEAARAGDAGRGFAVVAAEVKALAGQTAKATADIARQISEVQAATGESVASIREIGAAIAEVNHAATTIAAAVEEQDAATKEIARSVEEAARGTAEVTRNITGVTSSANDAGTAASDVLGAANELARQAETLRSSVDQFLSGVRAA